MAGEPWEVGPAIPETERREPVADKSPERQDVVRDSLQERKTQALHFARPFEFVWSALPLGLIPILICSLQNQRGEMILIFNIRSSE